MSAGLAALAAYAVNSTAGMAASSMLPAANLVSYLFGRGTRGAAAIPQVLEEFHPIKVKPDPGVVREVEAVMAPTCQDELTLERRKMSPLQEPERPRLHFQLVMPRIEWNLEVMHDMCTTKFCDNAVEYLFGPESPSLLEGPLALLSKVKGLCMNVDILLVPGLLLALAASIAYNLHLRSMSSQELATVQADMERFKAEMRQDIASVSEDVHVKLSHVSDRDELTKNALVDQGTIIAESHENVANLSDFQHDMYDYHKALKLSMIAMILSLPEEYPDLKFELAKRTENLDEEDVVGHMQAIMRCVLRQLFKPATPTLTTLTPTTPTPTITTPATPVTNTPRALEGWFKVK